MSSSNHSDEAIEEAGYNNFAATSTTNYLTVARNRNQAEVSSSDSTYNPQPNAREGLRDGISNGNGTGNNHGKHANGSKHHKSIARKLHVRRKIIIRQRKQIAMLQSDSELFKRILNQMDADGVLTDAYRRDLEVMTALSLREIIQQFYMFFFLSLQGTSPEFARILKDSIVPRNIN